MNLFKSSYSYFEQLSQFCPMPAISDSRAHYYYTFNFAGNSNFSFKTNVTSGNQCKKVLTSEQK